MYRHLRLHGTESVSFREVRQKTINRGAEVCLSFVKIMQYSNEVERKDALLPEALCAALFAFSK